MRHYNPRFVYFLPTFWKPKTFFKEVFSENSVLVWLVFKSGFWSRAGYSGACTVFSWYLKLFQGMKFLSACFWDSILLKFYIVLLKLVSIWLEISFYIWYQSIMIVLYIELLLCIIIIASLWIKKLHPNVQMTLIDYYYYLPLPLSIFFFCANSIKWQLFSHKTTT